jgi:Flp pilus assembly pilin Flp
MVNFWRFDRLIGTNELTGVSLTYPTNTKVFLLSLCLPSTLEGHNVMSSQEVALSSETAGHPSQEDMMKKLFVRFVREDAGQDLIEYAFLAVFIGLAVTVGLQAVATGINTQMSNIGSTVSAS